MTVCIIPARGGSKRIPHKNIREFCGKPMIAWTIEAARSSGCFERVVVSTEDSAVAEIGGSYGAEVPFERPPELADDHTPTVPVIAHAVEALDLGPDTMVCCMYATAPFVSGQDLQQTRALLESNADAFVLPVTTYPHPIQRALSRDSSGTVRMLNPSAANTRSQELEEAWHDTGQFYWALARTWSRYEAVFDGQCIGFSVPRYRVQDIDTPEDWAVAERMFRCETDA